LKNKIFIAGKGNFFVQFYNAEKESYSSEITAINNREQLYLETSSLMISAVKGILLVTSINMFSGFINIWPQD